MRERLPHLEDVHRRLRLVDADIGDVERRPVEDLQVRVALDRRDVLRLDEVVALDVPGLERLQARRVVGDGREDQRVELGRLAPVVVVPHEREAGARSHDSNLNGPVPIGCSVPNVPVGW